MEKPKSRESRRDREKKQFQIMIVIYRGSLNGDGFSFYSFTIGFKNHFPVRIALCMYVNEMATFSIHWLSQCLKH
jgi:hypothetical protein